MSTYELCQILSICDIKNIQDVAVGQIFRFRRAWCTRSGQTTFFYEKNGIKTTECIGDFINWSVAVPLKTATKLKTKRKKNLKYTI